MIKGIGRAHTELKNQYEPVQSRKQFLVVFGQELFPRLGGLGGLIRNSKISMGSYNPGSNSW